MGRGRRKGLGGEIARLVLGEDKQWFSFTEFFPFLCLDRK